MKSLKKGGIVLPVMECYAYRYDYGKGKTVLKVRVSASDATFAEVQEFFGEVADFEQWDGGMESLETVYTDYGADLDIHYKKPTDTVQADGSIVSEDAYYDIEVLRDPSLEADMRKLYKENEGLKATIQELLGTIGEIESGNQEREGRISGLKEEVSNLKNDRMQLDIMNRAMSQRINELEVESLENAEVQAELLYELCISKIEKEKKNGLQDSEKID